MTIQATLTMIATSLLSLTNSQDHFRVDLDLYQSEAWCTVIVKMSLI